MPVLGLVFDAITAIAALAAVRIAAIGLNTWKDQVKGQSRHDTGRKLIASLKGLERGFSRVRSALFLDWEFPDDWQRTPLTHRTPRLDANAYRAAYADRWNKDIMPHFRAIESNVYDFEAATDADIFEDYRAVLTATNALKFKIDELLDAIAAGDRRPDQNELRFQLHADGRDPDPLGQAFRAASGNLKSKIKELMS